MRHMVLGESLHEGAGGKYGLGDVVEAAVEGVLRSHGVPTIPISTGAWERHPMAGYVHRSYGMRGVGLSEVAPAQACRVTLYALPHLRTAHWRAELILIGSDPSGFLRLAGDSAQPNGFGAALSAAENTRAQIDAKAKDDGRASEQGVRVFVGGHAGVSTPQEQWSGFCLYGAARGVRVAWLAVSLTE